MGFFKTPLTAYSNGNVAVYLVDGSTIRDPLTEPYALDFTEGDNDAHNPDLVPPGEVWIDLDVAPTEVRATILHELTERRFMIDEGMSYEDAHDKANEAEEYGRAHLDEIDDLIAAELNRAPSYRKHQKITVENAILLDGGEIAKKAATEVKRMTEKVRKSFVFEVKEIGDRVLEFTGSTETMDRDGEVIKADGWVLSNYQKNPVVLFGHDYQSLPVAKCLKTWIEGGKLKFRDQFATADEYPFADTVYKLCKGGYLNTVSVGFIPLESENGKGEIRKVWTKQELLEHSIVPVPSNPDALVSARAAGVITVKEFDALTKPKEKEVSQGTIKDEVDYLLTLIEKVGVAEENKAQAMKLAGELLRLTGGDMPEKINKAAIRAMISPVLKAMADHDAAHQANYLMCKNALEEICHSDPMPDGDVPLLGQEDDKAAIRQIIEEYRRLNP